MSKLWQLNQLVLYGITFRSHASIVHGAMTAPYDGVERIRTPVQSSINVTSSTCNVHGPGPCTQQEGSDDIDQVNKDRGEVELALRCLGCGRFMHEEDVYPCMDCHKMPFHLECLETHYERAHPRLQPAEKQKKRTEEEEILRQEADDAHSQWVDQMANLSEIATPISHRIIGAAVAFVSVVLASESFWSPVGADAPMPLLQ